MDDFVRIMISPQHTVRKSPPNIKAQRAAAVRAAVAIREIAIATETKKSVGQGATAARVLFPGGGENLC